MGMAVRHHDLVKNRRPGEAAGYLQVPPLPTQANDDDPNLPTVLMASYRVKTRRRVASRLLPRARMK